MLHLHFQASNRSTSPQEQQHRSDDIHYNGSAVKKNQAFKAPLGTTENMEKHSALQSPGSSTSKANKQTPDKELHQRLQTRNNSSTDTYTTMPSVPQRDHVHSTSSQNQCAQGSTGQKAPTPTSERMTNSSTSNMGMDQNSPHGDKGTQMPSQEIHTTTFSQSTQFPSH